MTTFKNTFPHHWTFATAALRVAVTIQQTEIGYICYQQNTGLYFMAVAAGADAANWVQVGKGSQTVLPNNDSGVASSIDVGVMRVTVGAVVNGVTDWIVMPAIADVSDGFEITILCNAGGAFEIRTPAASGTKINTVDSDGTQEYLATDTETIKITKVSTADGWTATGYAAAGAAVAAVTPD